MFGQGTSHVISIKIKPYSNCTLYLASYYENRKIFADSTFINQKSEGVFKGDKKLTAGVYFIVSPANKILFEFLLSDDQHFTIVADTAQLQNIQYYYSPENDLFKNYTNSVKKILQQKIIVDKELSNAPSQKDSVLLQVRRHTLVTQFNRCKENVLTKAPTSLTALLLKAANPPELAEGTIIKTRDDTINAAQYIKQHYWDDIPLNDDRLLYTPFFDSKIDAYYKYYVSPVADSVIKEVNYMLLSARTGKEIYPYLLMKFTNRYYNPDHIGQNKVFLFLFNNFYEKGDTSLLDPQTKKLLFERAYQLMANQPGDQAPALDMVDSSGKAVSLYNVVAPYTLVVFWDPSCSHCQKEIPQIDSIYKEKWKGMGVKLFSVNINAFLMPEMLQFARDKNLSTDWLLTYQTTAAEKAIVDKGQPNYTQLYDVYETPTIYLLDAQKHIIAKHLSLQQFDEVIKAKNK